MTGSNYNNPRLVLSKEKIISIKDSILHSDQEIRVPLHHPLYRDIIRKYAQSIGKTAKSIIDQSSPEEMDSTLYVHSNCKKANPMTCLKWHDAGCDQSAQHAHCLNCNILLCTQYKGNKTSPYGYFKVKGKNCLVIK